MTQVHADRSQAALHTAQSTRADSGHNGHVAAERDAAVENGEHCPASRPRSGRTLLQSHAAVEPSVTGTHIIRALRKELLS